MFLIDEFCPDKRNYQFPPPLKSEQDKLSKKDAKKERSVSPAINAKASEKSKANKANVSKSDKMADMNLPEGERTEQNKILSNQQIVEKILNLQKLALENADFYVQLTYCETSYCHRFVHFEVDIDYIEQFEQILNEYIDSLKT